MSPPSRYDEAREKIRNRIAELEGLLATVTFFERAGIPPDSVISALDGASIPPHKSRPRANGHGGPRKVANPGAEPWREAIDEVLSTASTRLLVSEIVIELKRRGRSFGPNARPDTIVRATLNRCAARMGWSHTRKKPYRWHKNKEGEEGTD